MSVLSRLEERSEHTMSSLEKIDNRLGKHEGRIDAVEKRGYKLMGGLTVAALVWGWASKHITF